METLLWQQLTTSFMSFYSSNFVSFLIVHWGRTLTNARRAPFVCKLLIKGLFPFFILRFYSDYTLLRISQIFSFNKQYLRAVFLYPSNKKRGLLLIYYRKYQLLSKCSRESHVKDVIHCRKKWDFSPVQKYRVRLQVDGGPQMSVVLAWLGRPLRVSRIKTRLNTRSAGNNLSCKKGKLTRKRFVSSFSVNQTGFYDNFCTCRLRRARAGRSIFSMWWVQGTPTMLLL